MIVKEDNELETRNWQISIKKVFGSIEDQVEQMLEEQVNPILASRGGVVSLQAVDNADVYL